MATSKMMKPGEEESSSGIMSGFDFGDPEILPVEISTYRVITLHRRLIAHSSLHQFSSDDEQ